MHLWMHTVQKNSEKKNNQCVDFSPISFFVLVFFIMRGLVPLVFKKDPFLSPSLEKNSLNLLN